MKRTGILYILLLISCTGSPLRAERSAVSDSVEGTWIKPGESDSTFRWKAAWIWLNDSIDNHAMLARYEFDIGEGPLSAIVRITASDRYQLYVNGTYVCRGPARCAPHHQSYDILDISRLMITGKNCLAVRVHHQPGKWSYQFPGRAGLLVQAAISGTNDSMTIVSGEGWKVSPDPSWSNESPMISRFQDYVNDRVDMRRFVNGWTGIGFDDSCWLAATSLIRDSGWPLPPPDAVPGACIPPWTKLVPRDIPYVTETMIQAKKLVAICNPEDHTEPVDIGRAADQDRHGEFQQALLKAEPIIIPPEVGERSQVLIFDLGEVINGTPRLDIRGAPGTVVDVMCAPFMLDNHFTHKIVDSEYLDRIILSGKRDQWEATYFKPARFLVVAVSGNREEVHLHAVGMTGFEFPFEERGHIKSPGNQWAEQYWNAAKKTIRVCTTDGYTDNYRERRQYAQTGFYAALGNYWTFGDHSLQRRYLVQVAQEQLANGIMPAYAPLAGNDYMVIFDSNCLWVRSLRNYLLYSGDKATARQLVPAARSLMELFHSCTDKYGMINDPPYPYWLDHARLDRRGANMTLNGHYLGALEDFAQLLEWLEEEGGEVYRSRAGILRKSLRHLLWDENKQLFSDALINGHRSSHFSEHSNGLALALDLASPEQGRAIAGLLLSNRRHNYIETEAGITMVTPAMSYFLHKGLCHAGYAEASFRLFRERFDKMLREGTNKTLWEEWFLDGTGRSGRLQKKSRSDAQTESAFPPALFVEFLFGIQPEAPGMSEVSVAWKPAGIRHLEGKFPTPQGPLGVRWEVNSDSGMLFLSVPGGMDVLIDLESLRNHAGNQVMANGKRAVPAGSGLAGYRLGKGDHVIRF